MSATPLNTLRRRSVRRGVALLAAVAVFVAGLAQAAHFHKDEFSRGAETHLQCLLCLHADRWAGPPTLPSAPKTSSTVLARLVIVQTPAPTELPRADYDARGPPRA